MHHSKNAQTQQGLRSRHLVGVLSSLVATTLMLMPEVGQASKAEANAVSSASSSTSASYTTRAESLDLEALQRRAAEIQREVAAARGIPAETPVQVQISSADALRTRLTNLIYEEIGEERIRISQRVNEMFGLLGPGQSYLEIMLGALQRQVAGYYDHREQTFYLLDTDADNFSNEIVEHELVHALQDLRWPLGEIMRPGWSVSDISVSRSALIEGDATLFMLRQALAALPESQHLSALKLMSNMMEASFFETENEIPRFLSHSMISPYSRGLLFAASRYYTGREQWAGVNAAFDDLPLSTEQILYPERWNPETRDEPTFLTNSLGLNFLGEQKFVDVVGMLGIRGAFQDLLSRVSSTMRVDIASSGWDGDRLEFWESADSATIVWTLVFDSEDDAKRFYAMAGDTVSIWARSSDTRGAQGLHGERLGAATDLHGVVVERWGDLVGVVIREMKNPSTAEKLERETLLTVGRTLQTTQRHRYPERFRSKPHSEQN